MDYFVSPAGNDDNSGTQAEPFRTIGRGLRGASPAQRSQLQAGDSLTLRGGVYLEPVKAANLQGTAASGITIRGAPGERVVIDSGVAAFRKKNNGAWIRAVTLDAHAHPDEWVAKEGFPKAQKPNRGAFLAAPYRRLVAYSTLQDFRAESQAFGKLFDVEPFNPQRGPYRVTDEHGTPLLDPPENGREFTVPWVYMGPGLFLDTQDKATNRLRVRLSHTALNVPGLADYRGPTDPNEIGLAVCLENIPTLSVLNCQFVTFANLTLRFGGTDTVLIKTCAALTFDQVDICASTGGVRLGAVTGATFRNCRFDGGCPPWFFRTDSKAEYDCLLEEGGEKVHNGLAKSTIDVLMYGEGANKRDLEIHHCEFVNGHDLYLVAENTHFHHNWIDNLQDEGLVLDAAPRASGRIHSNVITRCQSAISMANSVFTAGQWSIYRNLIDLRRPIAGARPRPGGQEGENNGVFRFGSVFKSNETNAPDGPHDLFHNTFLVAEQREQAAYLHYRSALSPHRRRSFNNIFVAVNSAASDVAITIIPSPEFPGPTDGNVYHRYGAHDHPAFRSLPYRFNGTLFEGSSYANLAVFRESELFVQSKTQYAPGYEAASELADPQFRRIAADGSFGAGDDLRLRAASPAHEASIELPDDLQALDAAALAGDDAPAPPTEGSQPRAAGCYPFGGKPLRVGVKGRRRFPGGGATP